MPFAGLDTAAVARALAQVADRSGDRIEAYLERLELLELPADGEVAGIRRWSEAGLAVRLSRGGQVWMASRDAVDRPALAQALRQVARVHPSTELPLPELSLPELPRADIEPLRAFPRSVERAVRAQRLAFPWRLTLRCHRRDLQVVETQWTAAAEREVFFSCRAETPWGSLGALMADLGEPAAQSLAARLVASFRSREAPPPPPGRYPLVLGKDAAAVLLHEAVGHALEADTLARTGRPEAALGVQLAPPLLDVLDDPGAAPAGLTRRTDDEGRPVVRRWLLRQGRVAQLLADSRWSTLAPQLEPGAARRAHRHAPPGPRSAFLQLLPGEQSLEQLCARADLGLYLPEAERGRLDPASGAFTLRFPHGRRIRGGALGEPVGGCTLHGRVADLLACIAGVGAEATFAGAGWCAKGGYKLPVWGQAPHLLLAPVEVGP